MGLYSQEIQEKKKDLQNQSKTIKKMEIGTYISIITLNVNGLNASTKRHRLAEWIQKEDTYICRLQETCFRPKDTDRLRVRGWKNIFHANGKQKKAGVAILISDKTNLKIKNITIVMSSSWIDPLNTVVSILISCNILYFKVCFV